MSDPLASFFAKKDKKKSGRKSTSTRSNEQSKSNKEKDVALSAGPILRNILQDEGEWNDYEEQVEKDYSDLKIQALNLKDREEEFREQKALEVRLARQALQSENGGPWMRKNVIEQSNESSAASGDQKTKEEAKPVEEKPKEPSRYIPPHERHQAQAVSLKPTNARNKVAPEIKNEIEFPTLGKVATK